MGVNRFATAGALFATAAAWPWIVGALAGLLLSPYQRALQSSWCGLAPHDSFSMAGHCAACWIGSAVLIAVGLVVLATKENIPAHARSSGPRQR
jgi:hypothetical protein